MEELNFSALGVKSITASQVKQDMLDSVASKRIVEEQAKMEATVIKVESIRKGVERVS